MTDEDDASFSVIQAWALDAKNFYLIDQFRAQCEFDKLKRMARRFKARHRPYAILIEKTANGPALISELRRRSGRRGLIVPIIPHGSKSARLNRHIDKIHRGRVQLAEAAAFVAEVVAELKHSRMARMRIRSTHLRSWRIGSTKTEPQPTGRRELPHLCPWSSAATANIQGWVIGH